MLEKSTRAHKTCVEPMDERILTTDWIKAEVVNFCNDNLYVGDVVIVIDPSTVR